MKNKIIYLSLVIAFCSSAQNNLSLNIKNIWQANSISKNNSFNPTSVTKNDSSTQNSIYKGNTIFTNSVFKRYYLPKSQLANSSGIIETSNNNFILFGLSLDTLNSQIQQRLTLVGLDNSTNLVWRKSYGNFNFSFVSYLSSIVKKDNFLYAVSNVQDSNYKQPGIFIKFNFNGDTIWQKKYYINNDEAFFTNVCPSVDNGFLITGAVQTSTPGYNNHPIVATYLLKTDANGNKLWDKRFYKTNLDETQAGYKIIQDSITKKIIVVGIQANTSQYSNLQILDSLGNLITQKGMNTSSYGNALVDVIKLRDGNFVTVGTTVHNEVLINGNATGASTLIKFDINGNIVYRKEYDTLVLNNAFIKIFETKNNDIITGGVLSTLYQYGLGLNDISRIMKIDKNGNMLWKKYFDNYTTGGSLSNQDGLSDMIYTNDGNIAFTNYLNAGNIPKPIPYTFYKTDTSYCDANAFACATFVGLKENELQKQKISIYPNPTTGIFEVYISAPHNAAENYKIEITNTLGQVLLNQIATTNNLTLNT